MHPALSRLACGVYAALLLLLSSCEQRPSLSETQEKRGLITDSVMVVTAHPEATRVGVDILRKGGNAWDAAIAVQFALAVVYPQAGNIGGGGFMVSRDKNGNFDCLDFRETAPQQAHRDMFLDAEGNVITDRSVMGHLASGVPGSVEGMVQLHRKYGKLPWKELLQPAIRLARDGFALTEKEARNLNEEQENFKKYNRRPCSLQQDKPWTKGDILKQEELGHSLMLIADSGRAGFYEGTVARLLVAEMQQGGGIITLEDLRNYRAVWRKPLVRSRYGYTLACMPPPSSGGVALYQLLFMLYEFHLHGYAWQSTEYINLVAEAEKLVYADRSEYLGDPDFYTVPVDELLNESYLRRRMQLIRPALVTASETIMPGLHHPESEQTTHFSIVDADGNAVSLTTTINSAFGSRVMVEGAGFLLNNEMDDFSVKPGTPNQFGLVGNGANAIAPGKRMLSSMTPTIVEKDGQLLLVIGSPGGATIITSVMQNIVNVLVYGMGMQESVSAPRFHHQWLPDKLFLEEGRFDTVTIRQLQAMGYTVQQRPPIGRVDAILRLGDGRYEGGADPRGDDAAGGY